jgi:hypothetical protein
MRTWPAFAGVCTLLLTSQEAFGQVTCPSVTLSCEYNETTSSSAAGRTDCETKSGDASARYDLVRGIVESSGSHVCCAGGAGIVAHVRAEDRFTILGIPPGTIVSFAATLTVNAVGCGSHVGYGFGRAGLWENDSNAAWVGASSPQGGGCNSSNAVAQITLVRPAGEPFVLTTYAGSGGGEGGSGAATGTLAFAGLPPGATVQSCHGFRQEFAVPATPVSWGSLKQRYH